MSRVLVTRPHTDAARTAALIRAAGHEALVHPLMRIVPREGALAGTVRADALAVTSANGLRAYAAAGGPRLPVFAVGETSAAEAGTLGFEVAGTAEGDVRSLAGLIASASPGRVLHVSGARAAGDLAGALAAAGVPCERAVLYDAVEADALPGAATADIRRGLDWTMLHSPRSALLLTRLVRAAGLADAFRGVRLAALSPAVAEAAGLPFAETRVAARPASSALVDIVGARDT